MLQRRSIEVVIQCRCRNGRWALNLLHLKRIPRPKTVELFASRRILERQTMTRVAYRRFTQREHLSGETELRGMRAPEP